MDAAEDPRLLPHRISRVPDVRIIILISPPVIVPLADRVLPTAVVVPAAEEVLAVLLEAAVRLVGPEVAEDRIDFTSNP